MESRHTSEKINKVKGWFFEKIDEVDKSQTRITNKKKSKLKHKIPQQEGNS